MNTIRKTLAVAAAAGLVLGVVAQATAYEGGEVKDGGTISGSIKFAGAPPATERSPA